jgi:ubiquinone biosynthesis protein UbiJ
VIVTFVDTEPSGLAEMLGGLIEQNLAAHPARRRLLHPSVVTVDADDAAVEVTLRIAHDAVAVAEGSDPAAQVRIHADSGRLLAVVATPLRWGVPDLFSHAGRSLVADIVRGRVRIKGLVRHPIQLVRLTKLLNVNEGSA